jgi:hypothetical protein
MQQQVRLENLSAVYLPKVKEFTDRWIGKNYYTLPELSEVMELSLAGGLNASYLALVGDEIAGVRLTFSPGQWIEKKKKGTTPSKWSVEPNKVAYFKSLFIGQEYQKMGLGKKLSQRSIETLKLMGAQAIICHSWLESPENSSQRYLQSMGFEGVNDHPRFWYEIDYDCTRCGPERCVCTAREMIKYI